MPHFSGVDGKRVSHTGEIAHAGIPAFMQQCRQEGWVRVAVSEYRILASLNENGDWLHPELRGAA